MGLRANDLCLQSQGQRLSKPHKQGKRAGQKLGGKAGPKSKPNFPQGA